MRDELGVPRIVDRRAFQAELVEAMDNSYRLLDLTVYGRQEAWEDSPPGWPQRQQGQHAYRIDGRPIAQWPRLNAGYSDDLGTGGRSTGGRATAGSGRDKGEAGT